MKIAFHIALVGIATILSVSVSAQAVKDSGSASSAQQTHTLQREVPHKVQIQYLLFLPNGYEKSADRWPLILYLHGGSLRGEDIGQMRKLGLAEKVEADPNFPFIVVSPQCHTGEIWTDVDALGAVLDEVAGTHRVDPDRIYVTGHSMGGRGALYAAYKDAGPLRRRCVTRSCRSDHRLGGEAGNRSALAVSWTKRSIHARKGG